MFLVFNMVLMFFVRFTTELQIMFDVCGNFAIVDENSFGLVSNF